MKVDVLTVIAFPDDPEGRYAMEQIKDGLERHGAECEVDEEEEGVVLLSFAREMRLGVSFPEVDSALVN